MSEPRDGVCGRREPGGCRALVGVCRWSCRHPSITRFTGSSSRCSSRRSGGLRLGQLDGDRRNGWDSDRFAQLIRYPLGVGRDRRHCGLRGLTSARVRPRVEPKCASRRRHWTYSHMLRRLDITSKLFGRRPCYSPTREHGLRVLFPLTMRVFGRQ